MTEFPELLVKAVQHEDRVLWYDDPDLYPYLRQAVRSSYQRLRPVPAGPKWDAGVRVVGYATLLPSALSRPGGPLLRRVFLSKLADRDGSRESPPGAEAVDPRLVVPREITPWLWDSAYEHTGPRERWLAARRAELGLAPGQQAARTTPRRPASPRN